jgi:hydrogenase/urease accessory protein HupE
MRRACLLAVRYVLLLLTVLGAAEVRAHATQLSSSRLEIRGHVVDGLIEMNSRDLEVALAIRLAGTDGMVARDLLTAATDALGRYVLSHARVVQPGGGDACPGELAAVEPKQDHLIARVRWHCPPVTGRLGYEVKLFHDIDAASRHMVSVTGDARLVGLLSASQPRMGLNEVSADRLTVFRHYLMAGVEHIAIGYDHIAFLVVVIVWGRRFWPLARVVTAFTIAHSITLSLAVLDVVRLPGALVETLIALSIVYVAVENFFVRNLERRGWITFLFGLIHGFGFASVLRDYGLPHDALLPALAAFNAGVEVGQLAIVLACLGLLLLVDRLGYPRGRADPGGRDPRVVKAVSGVVLMLGLYWTIERLAG